MLNNIDLVCIIYRFF